LNEGENGVTKADKLQRQRDDRETRLDPHLYSLELADDVVIWSELLTQEPEEPAQEAA
jgi:hypothetical protein